MRWIFIKDAVVQNQIDLHHVDTKNNVAPGFIKPLEKEAHERFIHILCLN